MRTRFTLNIAVLSIIALATGWAQSPSSSTYVPGVTFQSSNPFYPTPNPFYFEGKIDWEKLNISQPSTAWEYMQRGIHEQDDQEDYQDAITDYEQALSLNSLANGTCQIITKSTLVNGALPGKLDPMPCMFTVRLRLAYLLRPTQPDTAIALFQEVLSIDPLKLGVSTMIGETYTMEAAQSQTPSGQMHAYLDAARAFQAELALSPITAETIALTADHANNARVHWDLAQAYEYLGNTASQMNELRAYLQATQWHSDVYPWRIALAKQKLSQAPQQQHIQDVRAQ